MMNRSSSFALSDWLPRTRPAKVLASLTVVTGIILLNACVRLTEHVTQKVQPVRHEVEYVATCTPQDRYCN